MSNISFRKHWNLTREIAISDFKLRYQGSVLGYLWSLVKPLLLFGVLYVVFSIFLRFQIEQYRLYLLLGIILWGFLADGTTSAVRSLEWKRHLITRVAFPRILIIVSSTLTSFITLCLNLVVFAVFFAFSDASLSLAAFLFLLLLVELYCVVLGTSLLVSALNMKLRDVGHIWDVLLQAGFWATPIIYSITMIPERYHFWIFLNPMTRIITYARDAVIYNTLPDLAGVMGSITLAVAILVLGFTVFMKREPMFAEEV